MKRGQIGGKHYEDMPIDPWAIIEQWPPEQQIGYHRGNVLKYIMRMGTKGEALQDVQKALHYCEKLRTICEKK